MDQKIYQQVIQTYMDNHSVSDTAKACGISIVKVRRILITEDLWSSRSSKEIGALYHQGFSVREIARKLSITEKNVQAYIPYSRGLYSNQPETKSALNSKAYRKRNNLIKENIIRGNNPVKGENMGEETKETSKRRKFEQTQPGIMRLHMELVHDDNDNDYALPDTEEERTLRSYGNVKYGHTISRDILTPSDIPLYSLHYVIQRLFGWQNSHLHHFLLPDETMKKLTDNKIGKWSSLAGILFRYPDINDDDRFWMDDYESGSFRNWLRRKYTGPYFNNTEGEDFLSTLRNTENDAHHYPYLSLEYTEFNGNKRLTDAYPLEKNISINRTGLSSLYKNSRSYRKTVSREEAPLDALFFLYDGSTSMLLERLPVGEIMNTSVKEVSYANYMAEIIPQVMEYLSEDYPGLKDQPHPIPLTNTLYYNYDYGDNWKVRITVMDSDCNDLIKEHRINQADLDKATESLKNTYHPVCIAADGLNVMDDAGGLYGYTCFLRSIHPDEEAEYKLQNHIAPDEERADIAPYTDKQDSLYWARENFGWKNKMPVPERIL